MSDLSYYEDLCGTVLFVVEPIGKFFYFPKVELQVREPDTLGSPGNNFCVSDLVRTVTKQPDTHRPRQTTLPSDGKETQNDFTLSKRKGLVGSLLSSPGLWNDLESPLRLTLQLVVLVVRRPRFKRTVKTSVTSWATPTPRGKHTLKKSEEEKGTDPLHEWTRSQLTSTIKVGSRDISVLITPNGRCSPPSRTKKSRRPKSESGSLLPVRGTVREGRQVGRPSPKHPTGVSYLRKREKTIFLWSYLFVRRFRWR